MTAATKTMEGVGGARGAALVLLYAASYEKLPAAITIPPSGLVIGREPEAKGEARDPASFTLIEQGVSRSHARIESDGDEGQGGLRIVDLGSKNGVIVNGVSVRQADLEHDDVIRIGDVLFKLALDGPADSWLPYRIDGAIDRSLLLHPPVESLLLGGQQMQTLLHQLARIAGASELSVLVQGETGTGKDLVARAIQQLSKKPVTILDEVADLSSEEQSKLVRELVDRGRVVSTTHRDLPRLQSEGKFRADLLARLAGYTIELPPLRERKEDLFQLVRHFAKDESMSVSLGFMVTLCHHEWPFNVRELENAIDHARAIRSQPMLVEKDLPPSVREAMHSYGTKRDTVTRARPFGGPTLPSEATLRAELERTKGNVSELARHFAKDRTQIHRWLRHYGLTATDFRT